MFKRLSSSFFALLVLSFATAPLAAKPALIPSPPQVSASSYILIDIASGEVIVEENADQRLPPASLTKMMTAYIVEGEISKGLINLYDEVPVSVKAWRTGGSKMFIKEGTKVALEDLLKGVIIQSGNDASIALAEYVAGSEDAFADIMNQQAQALGMENSNFFNATGLPDEGHYSSARDLAILASAIITEHPDLYSLYSEKFFTYNNIRQPNRNRLLWRDKSVDGMKTGHTQEAGYCLVASAKRGDMRLISVVMGTNSEETRAKETQKLLNYGFRYFETQNLYNAAETLATQRVWGGELDELSLGLAEDVVITIPKGQKPSLKAQLDIEETIKAPIAIGQELGRLTVKLGDKIVVDEALVALEEVPEGGFFKRLLDAIKLFFAGLFG